MLHTRVFVVHTSICTHSYSRMKVGIITQNVDGLQQRAFGNCPQKNCDPASKRSSSVSGEIGIPSRTASAGRPHPQLIQAHGQKGLFKCLSSASNCPYASVQSWTGPQLTRPITEISQVPRCPGCGELCPPQLLQFDEDYESHAFYQIDKVQ